MQNANIHSHQKSTARTTSDSVITLGRVGNHRAYVLQETVPISPYNTNARRIVDYYWRGKSP